MAKPRIRPIGIGDLMVEMLKLARYEAGEIAHIENVMASESRGRKHRRLHQIEETVTVEQERSEENKRDLQSTERFELQQETQKTIQSDTKFEAGVEISAGFGPVHIGAFARFSTSQTKTESDRNATNYAKEITERSLSQIVERVREERTTRTLEEFEEENFHSFENASGGNISGVYRWVDKYYRAKVINYGKRLFYEFIVPEPAAFYLFAKSSHISQNILPEEPEQPRHPVHGTILRPRHINRENYLRLIGTYGAEDVSPPPPETIIISRMVTREVQEDQHWAFADSELQIPEGYVYSGHNVFISPSRTENWRVTGLLSTFVTEVSDETGASGVAVVSDTPLPQISGTFPIGAQGFGINGLVIAVEIFCELTDEAFEEWRLRTYNAIMTAYYKRVLDYEEKLAAAQIQEGVHIGGNNPLINRAIEREELKKGCITLWTGFKYTGVPAITRQFNAEPPDNYPEIHIGNSLEVSPDIQFLEQAFDWKNMTYEFYPYYWKRKQFWLDVYSLSDPDPLFADFLRAGAARVRVPVHLSTTEAVLYYQMTGELWSGGEAPLFSPPSPSGTLTADTVDEMDEELALYNSYLAELSGEAAIDTIDQDVEISPDDPDTWLVKVPTTLVWLQADATLPDFELQPG
jgi:hypothetical protein